MDKDDSRTSRSNYTSKKMWIAVGMVALVVLVAAGVIFGINLNTHKAEHETEPSAGMSQMRHTRHAQQPRISQDSPTYMCSIDHPLKEPYECPNVRHDKHVLTQSNGERYLKHRGKKYSFVDIQDWLNQPKENRDSGMSRIPCCMLSFVANSMNMCPGAEQYECYIDDTDDSYNLIPRCEPPKMECKCYQSHIAICEEDKLPWCNSHTNGEQCRYKTETDAGVQLRCICNTTQGDVPALTDCSKLSVAARLNEHRISQDSQNKKCSIELPSQKEAYQCENSYNRYIKNSSNGVYLKYRGKTYYPEDIAARLKQPNGSKDSRRNTLPCCLLSYMGNLLDMCPGSEQYACFMDETVDNYTLKPQCGLPKVKFGCKCYQSQNLICTEDKLQWCHDHTNSTECRHETATDGGANLRCICNTTQQEDPETILCSKLSSVVDKNDVYIDYRRNS